MIVFEDLFESLKCRARFVEMVSSLFFRLFLFSEGYKFGSFTTAANLKYAKLVSRV